jgi:hypothetical protein
VKMKWLIFILTAFLISGCASVNWDSRVGKYTNDQAITDYGPPDSQSKLSNGHIVYSWITGQGRNWTDKIILTFNKQGQLVSGQEKRL